jgi:hypothetical protein
MIMIFSPGCTGTGIGINRQRGEVLIIDAPMVVLANGESFWNDEKKGNYFFWR